MHADTVSILFFDTTLLLGKPIFLSHMDHLGVSLLQQISKSMGFAGLVCFFGYLLCELQSSGSENSKNFCKLDPTM